MLPDRLCHAAFALLVAGSAAAQPRPASEQIGSWVLSCPAEPPAASCQLRYQSWILPPGTALPSAALEVLKRGEQFVPVVAVRGLSMQAALGGALALQIGLRFDNAPRTALACALDGADVVCAPEGSGVVTAADQLVTARSVLVQIQLGLPGGTALPEQSRTLDLQRTADALARFRATAPAGETMPIVPGLDWRGLLDRLLRDAGYEHGIADVLPGAGTVVGGRRP